ncbi:magnesium transporter [Brevibacterium sp. JNUCC-42]|nr:magnesium transporter [Brevibacterium sp. JNUCC-42]
MSTFSNQSQSYKAQSTGSMMKSDFFAIQQNQTVDEVIQQFRQQAKRMTRVHNLYVIDPQERLIGVLSLRELFISQANQTILDVMKSEVVSVPVDMDQEEAAKLLQKHDFVSLPVITNGGKLVGLLHVDEILDVVEEEATEDFQKLGGSQPLEVPYFKNSIWGLFRKRIGWLLILFVAEAYTGNVLQHFEDTLSEVVTLAFFIPLLIGTGGNSGTQTVTTLVRALAIGEVKFKDIFKVMRKEVSTGVLLGLCIGIAALIRAGFLGVGFDVGTVVAVTASFIVVWASIVAAALPLILHKLKIDPAVVSGPFITTLVDGTGLIIYFTMAKLLLNL